MAQIKDSLRRIEEKLDRLLEQKQETKTTPVIADNQVLVPGPMTMEERMAKARAARKVNTGEEGRG